jgi:hypothetical protein
MISVKLEHKPKTDEQNEKWVAVIDAEPHLTIESGTRASIMNAVAQELADRWPGEEMVLDEVVL